MQLLLDDALAPVTSEIGFLEAQRDDVVEAFSRWMTDVLRARGIKLQERKIRAPLKETLLALEPLTSVEALRYLFVPTRSKWVAYFDNGWRGTDAFGVISYLSELLGVRGVRVTAVENTIRTLDKETLGNYGALTLEVYGSEGDGLGITRSISLMNDGGRWAFELSGTPFPFEDLEKYKSKKLTERFSFEDLVSYTSHLGLQPFQEEFYLPESDPEAVLMEKVGAPVKGLQRYSLQQARADY